MKKGKNILKKLLSVFLSFVIILTALPISSMIIEATENEELPVLDFLDEYSAKSSTAIKKLSSIVEASGKKTQYSALLKRAGGYASLIGGSIDAIRGAINSYDSNDEWYKNIWNIGSGAVAGFLGLNSSNASNSEIQYDLEEIKSMIEDMDQDIKNINNKLDDLEETVQTNFDVLSNKIVNKIQETKYEEFLNQFTQTSDSNAFSYYSFFKPGLNQRYSELLIALNAGDEDNIKQAYDNLYLIAKQSEQLYYFVSGESTILTGKQSIQDILYDYSILSSEENFELTCIQFAEDVYSTYLFSQYCLSLCYN